MKMATSIAVITIAALLSCALPSFSMEKKAVPTLKKSALVEAAKIIAKNTALFKKIPVHLHKMVAEEIADNTDQFKKIQDKNFEGVPNNVEVWIKLFPQMLLLNPNPNMHYPRVNYEILFNKYPQIKKHKTQILDSYGFTLKQLVFHNNKSRQSPFATWGIGWFSEIDIAKMDDNIFPCLFDEDPNQRNLEELILDNPRTLQTLKQLSTSKLDGKYLAKLILNTPRALQALKQLLTSKPDGKHLVEKFDSAFLEQVFSAEFDQDVSLINFDFSGKVLQICNSMINKISSTDWQHALENVPSFSIEGGTAKVIKLSPYSIEQLNLSCNRLTDIPPLPAAKVRLLDLASNKITNPKNNVPYHILALCLESNGMHALPPNISQCTQLQSLDLFNNKLDHLPDNLSSFTSLYCLNVGMNPSLKHLPNLPASLERLRIDNTAINKLPDNVTQLTNLKKLTISRDQQHLLKALQQNNKLPPQYKVTIIKKKTTINWPHQTT